MKWKGTRSLDYGAHRRVSIPEEHCGCGKGRVVCLWGFLDHEASEAFPSLELTMPILFSTPPYTLPSFSCSAPYRHLFPGEHAYKCSWCSFSTMTISQLKEHSLKVHGKALTLPRPRIVSLLSSHAHHSSQKTTPAEEVEDSNGNKGLRSPS